MASQISVQEIVRSFRDTLGQEEAYRLIHNNLDLLGLGHLQYLQPEDMTKLCALLKEKGGFIAILADILQARVNLRS